MEKNPEKGALGLANALYNLTLGLASYSRFLSTASILVFKKLCFYAWVA